MQVREATNDSAALPPPGSSTSSNPDPQEPTEAPWTFAELSDPAALAKEKGFAIGTVVYEKIMGPSAGLYIVHAVTSGVTIETRAILPGVVPTRTGIGVDAFLHQFVVSKGACLRC